MSISLYDYCMKYDKKILLQEWHPTKNAPLTPETITYGSKKKIWWRCDHGHEWEAAVCARAGAGSGCPYCCGQRPFVGFNDLASQRPDLTAEWHPTKNGMLTPDRVTVNSHKAVWWQCAKGHEWRARLSSRSAGCGCPVCAGKTIISGFNDLATTHPDLAAQWHPSKNETLRPDQVMAGTNRKVWWQCSKGHEWQAVVSSRAISGNGCPVCSCRAVVPGENDLATRFPAVAGEWHPTKNGSLTPQTVSPYSNRRVWWRCPLGHEYQACISSHTISGHGCLYCSGKKVLPGFNDLASQMPEIAGEWHPTLNGDLTAEMVTPGSVKKVWWRCQLGHEYQACISSRTGNDTGCPVCAGRRVLSGFNDLASQEPKIAAQWHPTLNGDLTAEMVTPGSGKKVWWRCPLGHEWKTAVVYRARGRKTGCPVCAGKVNKRRMERYEKFLAEAVQAMSGTVPPDLPQRQGTSFETETG